VEEGHSEGIITSKLDRFGRDLIGGALALKRITEADGRLVCVEDGFDSASPGSELMFNLRMAIAQDYLSRTRTNFRRSAEDAAKGASTSPAARRSATSARTRSTRVTTLRAASPRTARWS
jgi:DNA invertase Pin-like site-specific DNA recombinase